MAANGPEAPKAKRGGPMFALFEGQLSWIHFVVLAGGVLLAVALFAVAVVLIVRGLGSDEKDSPE
jgi:hypothetical protein